MTISAFRKGGFRGGAVEVLRGISVAVVAFVASVGLAGCGDNGDTATNNNVEPTQIASDQSHCSAGIPVENKEVGVVSEYEVRSAPAESADRIKNEKASEALGTTHYHVIDNSTTVRQLCADNGWTEVQIVSPEWLSFVRGWVPNSTLRGIDRTPDGKRVYVESDVIWDDDTSPYKSEIVRAINQFARKKPGCDDIDPSVVARSPSKSKPGRPVFFVVCGLESTPFNVFFEPN